MNLKRTYRQLFKGSGLVFFEVKVFETDLMIGAERLLDKEAQAFVRKYRTQIEQYTVSNREFAESLKPVEADRCAPCIVQRMCSAARSAHVGPMASVAGAIAEMTGTELLQYSREVIVENGGDIFLKSSTVRKVGVYAGASSFSKRIALEIRPGTTPLGICTSSGTVGHSFSFGKADAAVIAARDTFLADAVATAACNMVHSEKDLEKAVDYALDIKGVEGALAIMGNRMAVRGDIRLVPV